MQTGGTQERKGGGGMKLKHRTWATGIHEITGKPTEEGYLEAGTLVRDVEPTGAFHPLDGAAWFRFAASTDGGQTWFKQEVCGKVEVQE